MRHFLPGFLVCMLAMPMAIAQDVRDSSGRLIARISKNEVRSSSGSLLYRFDGNEVRTRSGSIYLRIDGTDI
jgi:hypothetical protein